MRGQSWNQSRMLLGGSSKLSTRETFPWKNQAMTGAAASNCSELPILGMCKQRLRGFGHELGHGLDDL